MANLQNEMELAFVIELRSVVVTIETTLNFGGTKHA